MSGTMGFTLEMHGAYLLLLIHQFHCGHFTEETAKSIVGNTFEKVKHKFKKDPSGGHYNERLEAEQKKRQKFSASRKKNVMSRWDKANKPLSNIQLDDIHMNNICNTRVIHMENENKEEKKRGVGRGKEVKKSKEFGPKKYPPPTFEEFEKYCAEKGYKNIAKKVFEYYDVANWKDSRGNQVKSWKQKLLTIWFTEENMDAKKKDIRYA